MEEFALSICPFTYPCAWQILPCPLFTFIQDSCYRLHTFALCSGCQICQKSWRIGCAIPCCKLQCGITQPILRLFWHICTDLVLLYVGSEFALESRIHLWCILCNRFGKTLDAPKKNMCFGGKFGNPQVKGWGLSTYLLCLLFMVMWIFGDELKYPMLYVFHLI